MTTSKGKQPLGAKQLAATVPGSTGLTPEPQQTASTSRGGKGRLKTMTHGQRSKAVAKHARTGRKKRSKQANVWPFP
jgi:hypothetical protein